LIIAKIDIPDLKLLKRGKVRDIFYINDNKLLIVSTDRISAFDYVLKSLIPFKGVVLNKLSIFWFQKLNVDNHFLTDDLTQYGLGKYNELKDRSMVVQMSKPLPFEFIIRGYIVGGGYREYKKNGSISGIKLPDGLSEGDRLPEPIFTPTTKEETGHDRPVKFEELVNSLGEEKARYLRDKAISIYKYGKDFALQKGIIIADTKFEFGEIDGRVILIDEALTPDSSRFFDLNEYNKGHLMNLDKEYVRAYLLNSGWERKSSPPPLPEDVVKKTSERYIKIYEILTGNKLGSG